MARTSHLLGVAAAVLFAGIGVARAGLTGITSVDFSGDTTIMCSSENYQYWDTNHTLSWSVAGGDGSITETDHEHAITSDTHTYNLTVAGDPTMTLSSLVINNSGVTWIGYDVTISTTTPGTTVAFSGTPTSTPKWQDIVVVNPATIHYSGVTSATPLADTESDTLVYTVVVTPPSGYTGSVALTITSTPILGAGVPEPASLGLLALGAVGLLARRRR